MSAPSLPPELRPWEDALGVFELDLAVGLGPVVRTLDALLAARTDAGAATGERDGWAGLARRGDPDRLLVSEWLLADEFPDEFLRRAVSSELIYLDPAYRDDTPHGRIVCVADVGPDQLGAARLLQLAAMVVLARRAVSLGTTLRVGLASGGTVTWHDGAFDVVATAWLRARSTVAPEPDAFREHLDTVGPLDPTAPASRPDEVWVLCGPDLAGHLRGRPRTVVSAPGDWDDDGLRTIRVRVEDRTATVTLPPAAISVRALRGTGFAPAPGAIRSPRAPGVGAAGLRWPAFPGAGRRLVARGGDDRTVVTLAVDPQQRNRPKRHGFGAPVLAAGTAGPRLIVLLDRGDHLEVQVVGRPLAGLHGLDLPRPAGIPDHHDRPLDPLILVDRTLLWRRPDRIWWQLAAEGIAVADAVVAVGWSVDDASPRVVRADAWPADLPESSRTASRLLLGPHRSAAWTVDDTTWTLYPPPRDIVVDAGDHVLGLAVVDDRIGLVTESASRLVVRFRTSVSVRTFTRQSGGSEPTHRSLHPTRPWLLVSRPQGTSVVDLENDAVVLRELAP